MSLIKGWFRDTRHVSGVGKGHQPPKYDGKEGGKDNLPTNCDLRKMSP